MAAKFSHVCILGGYSRSKKINKPRFRQPICYTYVTEVSQFAYLVTIANDSDDSARILFLSQRQQYKEIICGGYRNRHYSSSEHWIIRRANKCINFRRLHSRHLLLDMSGEYEKGFSYVLTYFRTC
jgi:hypothetical protein